MKKVFQREFNHLDRQVHELLLRTGKVGGEENVRILLYEVVKTQKRMLKLMENLT